MRIGSAKVRLDVGGWFIPKSCGGETSDLGSGTVGVGLGALNVWCEGAGSWELGGVVTANKANTKGFFWWFFFEDECWTGHSGHGTNLNFCCQRIRA